MKQLLNAMLSRKKLARRGEWLIVASLILILGSTRCSKQEVGTTGLKLKPTLESIQRDFVNTTCLHCHTQAMAANRYVTLVDLSTVIEKPGHDHTVPHVRYLIKPGCPKESFFLSIIKSGEMPPAGGINNETIQTLETFIKELDPTSGKKCDDEPPDGPL